MASSFLLEDKFTVTSINKDGKYYTKGIKIFILYLLIANKK